MGFLRMGCQRVGQNPRRCVAALANREIVQVRVVEDQDVVRAQDHLGQGLGVVSPGDVAEREPVFDDAPERDVEPPHLFGAFGRVAADQMHEFDEELAVLRAPPR